MTGDAPPTFFFLHVMKTAGTSFAHQVNTNFAPDEIYPRPDSTNHMEEYWKLRELRALGPEDHERIRAFHGHFPYLAADMVGADTTLTILRDPVERTISHLRHCERHFSQHHGKPLEEIYDDSWHGPLLFRNYQVKQFAMVPDDQPKAHTEVIEVDAARYEIATANLEEVDVLGLTAHYDEFLDEVERRFDWRITRGLRRQVAGGTVDVPASLRARIVADSAADLAFYDHARRLHERRRGTAR